MAWPEFDWLTMHLIETTASAGVPFADTSLGQHAEFRMSMHKLDVAFRRYIAARLREQQARDNYLLFRNQL